MCIVVICTMSLNENVLVWNIKRRNVKERQKIVTDNLKIDIKKYFEHTRRLRQFQPPN